MTKQSARSKSLNEQLINAVQNGNYFNYCNLVNDIDADIDINIDAVDNSGKHVFAIALERLQLIQQSSSATKDEQEAARAIVKNLAYKGIDVHKIDSVTRATLEFQQAIPTLSDAYNRKLIEAVKTNNVVVVSEYLEKLSIIGERLDNNKVQELLKAMNAQECSYAPGPIVAAINTHSLVGNVIAEYLLNYPDITAAPTVMQLGVYLWWACNNSQLKLITELYKYCNTINVTSNEHFCLLNALVASLSRVKEDSTVLKSLYTTFDALLTRLQPPTEMKQMLLQETIIQMLNRSFCDPNIIKILIQHGATVTSVMLQSLNQTRLADLLNNFEKLGLGNIIPKEYTILMSQNANTADFIEALLTTINLNNSGLVQQVMQSKSCDILQSIKNHPDFHKIIQYFNKNSISYKYKVGQLIVGPQVYLKNELYLDGKTTLNPTNTLDSEQTSKTKVINGQIYFEQTNKLVPAGKYIYVKDYKGTEYMTEAGHHSYMFKGNPKNPETFGIGRDVACGGHVWINEQGQKVKQDNHSGHYNPTREQLIVSIYQDILKGILRPNAIIQDHTTQQINLQDITQELVDSILANYPEIYDLTYSNVGMLQNPPLDVMGDSVKDFVEALNKYPMQNTVSDIEKLCEYFTKQAIIIANTFDSNSGSFISTVSSLGDVDVLPHAA